MGIGKLVYDVLVLFDRTCFIVFLRWEQRQAESEGETAVAEARRDEVKYVNSLKLVSPERNRLYSFGEEMVVEFESKERFGVDSSVVYVDGREVARLKGGVSRCTLPVGEQKVGAVVVKVVAWHPENKRGWLRRQCA